MEPTLCFVTDQWAYFTTAPLDLQHGVNWDKAPYERVAGPPFAYDQYDIVYQAQLLSRGRKPWAITRVAFTGNLRPPGSRDVCSRLSVDDINAKKAPWLSTADGSVKVWAGTTLGEFRDLVREAGSAGIYIQPSGA